MPRPSCLNGVLGEELKTGVGGVAPVRHVLDVHDVPGLAWQRHLDYVTRVPLVVGVLRHISVEGKGVM
jgi:hypothetical protein